MRIVGWIHAIGGLTLAALAATAFLWPQLLWGEPNGGDIGASLEREADGGALAEAIAAIVGGYKDRKARLAGVFVLAVLAIALTLWLT